MSKKSHLLCNDELGDIAEDFFRIQATMDGLTVTPPSRDKHGWDFHVQFKNECNIGLLDQKESTYLAYVQVKGFACDYSKYKGRNIALSNIHNMISDDTPFFIVFVDVNNKDLYFVHVGEEIITKGLENIRKAQLEAKPLNRVMMKVNPHKYNVEKISRDDHHKIKNYLIKIIGNSPSKYRKYKNSYWTNIGYEEGKYSLKAKLPVDAMLDIKLGVRKSYELEFYNFNSIRFGMEIPYDPAPQKIELLSYDSARSLGLPSHLEEEKETLYIQKDKLNIPIYINGTIGYISTSANEGIGYFNSKYIKLSIPFLNNKTNPEIQILYEKIMSDSMPLSELENQVKAIVTLTKESAFYLGLKEINNGKVGLYENSNKQEIKEVNELHDTIKNFINILDYIGIKYDIKVKGYDLLANKEGYEFISQLLSDNGQLPLKFTVPLESLEPGEISIFLPIQIFISGEDYIIPFNIKTNIIIEDKKTYPENRYDITMENGCDITAYPAILASKDNIREIFKQFKNSSIQKLAYTLMIEEKFQECFE